MTHIEQTQLRSAIDALESQRPVLGDALVDAALQPLKARLQATPVARALRQVSVLFLDTVESTRLSRQLDPEDVASVMDLALARWSAVVVHHGGRVVNYAGDSVLAVFGFDEVREDDAERAVLAGLALLQESRDLAQHLRQHYGRQGLAVRVGIHTGPVLVGSGVDTEAGVRGVTVNLAARMEQSAPPGSLRISHDTYRLIRGVFDVQSQEPIVVHGFDEPMRTYLVERRKPRAFRVEMRSIDGVETRMIGRDAELLRLQDAFHTLYREAHLQVIHVRGEAGLGKSRLLAEFENWAETCPEKFYFFQGRAQPVTQSQPYGLLRDVLSWRMQIADGDSMEQARRKLEDGLVPLFETDDGAQLAQAHAHILGHLIGLDFSHSPHLRAILDDARQIRNRGFHAATQLLRRLWQQDGLPLIMVLDDLQYADDGSLDFLDTLCRTNQGMPLLLVTLARPSLRDWPGTQDRPEADTVLTLAPLDTATSRQLATSLLSPLGQVPAALRELVMGGAEGNPFYMEELVRMLIDERVLLTHELPWRVDSSRLLHAHVPATLTGVLQARLDSLPAAARRALQQASVIGTQFWERGLAVLDPEAPHQLEVLMQHGLVTRHTEGFDASLGRSFTFAHQLLHQVTYDTVLKRARRALHAQIAQWLCGLQGAREFDLLPVIAEHYDRADDASRAGEWYARAAEYAASRYAHEAALDYVGRAMDRLARVAEGDVSPLRWRLLSVREHTFSYLGQREAQRETLEAMQVLADTLQQLPMLSDVAYRRSSYAMRVGNYADMELFAHATINLAKQAGDRLLRLRGLQRLALAHAYQGDAERGHDIAQEGLAQARACGERAIEALFFNALSVIAEFQADQSAAIEWDRQDLTINRELGNRSNEAIALGNLASGWLNLGAFDEARACLEQSLQLARQLGDRSSQPQSLYHMAMLEWRQGNPALTLQHARAALDVSQSTNNLEGEALAYFALGLAELDIGHVDAAHTAFHQVLALATDDALATDARAGLARAQLTQQNPAAALTLLEPVLARLQTAPRLHGSEAPRLVQWTCVLVLRHHDAAAAQALLTQVGTALREDAQRISDAGLRASFLQAIAEHREILLGTDS